MIVKYGNYTFAANSVNPKISQTNNATELYRDKVTINIELNGEIHETTPARLIVALRKLENAFSVDYLRLQIISDGGIIHDFKPNSLSLGPRITQGVDYPEDGRNDAEGGIFRTFRIILQQENVGGGGAGGGESNITSQEQTIRFEGGGKNWVLVPTLIGKPVLQILNKHTIYYAYQFGSVTVRKQNTAQGQQISVPPLPPPLWPDDEVTIQRVRDQIDTTDERTFVWSYSFMSQDPFG
jgi:hypothetical protein